VDVERFEAMVADGRHALADGDAAAPASGWLSTGAVARGAARRSGIEPFAQARSRVRRSPPAALEDRIDADLMLW